MVVITNHFFSNDAVSWHSEISSCICFFLQDPDGDRNAEMAINNPGDYVLKPQREGGGTKKVT